MHADGRAAANRISSTGWVVDGALAHLDRCGSGAGEIVRARPERQLAVRASRRECEGDAAGAATTACIVTACAIVAAGCTMSCLGAHLIAFAIVCGIDARECAFIGTRIDIAPGIAARAHLDRGALVAARRRSHGRRGERLHDEKHRDKRAQQRYDIVTKAKDSRSAR